MSSTTFSGRGRRSGFFFLFFLFFSIFLQKILVGQSRKLFKTFPVGRNLGRSIGRENLLKTFYFLKTFFRSGDKTRSVGGSKQYKQAIYCQTEEKQIIVFCFLSLYLSWLVYQAWYLPKSQDDNNKIQLTLKK